MGKIDKVKKLKRESSLLKEVLPLIRDVFIDSEHLKSYSLSRVEISKSGGMCRFYVIDSIEEKTQFDNKAIEELKLYGPSLRQSVGNILGKKYSPEVRFTYDSGLAKSKEIDSAFDRAFQKESSP